ncbi:DUF2235 domain-containing protein [Xanthomonas sp. XNM01]|uniref:phospholipase effector Tle1 domain-containing protein n=1 Tax=Xanthomonas sp. XNM01 TaxID=2769289 RepID=UPI00177E4478|nr:DUF2235 domain-containing protein [Xanthomonas sp. XNM01]MBD9367359.1 DUF2235 domain-containing protein [Xanthomonas sp. XNM01]
MGSGKHPDGVATDPFTAEQQATYTRASEQLAAFHTPVLVDSSRPDERLFVAAFDGTGNSMYRDAPENHTNVAQIYQQIEDLSKKGIDHIGGGYVEGPGTQGGLAGVRDLVSGHSYEARVEEMYLQFVTQASRWIRENPDADIRLAAIGFSRGAEQAAGFTRMVEERGIQNPEGAKVNRDRNGLVEPPITFTQPPLREPGTVIQAAGLFDPVGTGAPRDHDRRLASSVMSAFQITANDERRNLFQSTPIADPGLSADGRALNVGVGGVHSGIGGGYSQNGVAILSGNLMIRYINSLSGEDLLKEREVPTDPALFVNHRSEDHRFFYRTNVYDQEQTRGRVEELAPPALCRLDCRDAMPRNEAMAARLEWRPVGPTEVLDNTALVERLLHAAMQGDDAAIRQVTAKHLDSEAGQAWLRAGQEQLQRDEGQRTDARQAPPARESAPTSLPEPAR